jgi:hypothetical protein
MHVLQHRYLEGGYLLNFGTGWFKRMIAVERIEKVESGRYVCVALQWK